MDRFLIIDGNSLLNRAFYALPLLSNKRGEFSNAVYGFTNIFVKALLEIKPKHVVVAFDYGKKTFRNELYADYKGTRKKTPTELVEQFSLVKKLLGRMNVKVIEKSGIEADDIIGTLSKATNESTIILSGDKDVLQLIDKTTEVWLTRKGISEVEKVGEKELKEKFGWTPDQVIDFKALCGESSDNIPGVAGVGEKTAQNLLNEYGSLKAIYENLEKQVGKLKEKLENGKESAYLSQKLATIVTDCDIEFNIDDCGYDFPFGYDVFEFFEEYDFRSLLKRTELFVNSFPEKEIENVINCDVVKATDDKIEIIKKSIMEDKQFAFDTNKKITFSISPNFRYEIEDELTLFSLEDNVAHVMNQLADIFSNEKIEKIFFDYKKILHFTNQYGISIKGKVFDLSIANYLETAGIKQLKSLIETNEFFAEKKKLEKSLEQGQLREVYEQIELPLVKVLFEMENYGFRIDKDNLAELSQKYNLELKELSSKIFQEAGEEFNINSPKQLSQILFEKLGIVAYNNKKNSTSIDVLNDIEERHAIVPLIIRYRKIQKLVSTYVDAFLELANKGDGLIHTVFNQTLTATGRLSSSEPNLQNIPVRDEEGKMLRKVFVSKFENGKIMSADYNQIELRLLAAFSNDDKLVKAFNDGNDIHRATASDIFDKPISLVTANERRSAKAVNFGVIYGISDYGLSQNIGISRKDAKAYIDKYFSLYPKVKEYMNNNVAIAKQTGEISTCFGRVRKIEEIKSQNFNMRAFGERVAMNMPLQGSASDIIKIAMVRVFERLKKEKLKSQLILQIHDELIIDVFPGEEKQCEAILKDEMEHVVSLQVDLPVDVSYGETWFDAK